MFRKILLAYDGSIQSAAALRKSAELSDLCGAELHILGVAVATGTVALLQVDAPHDFFKLERTQVEKALESAANELATGGLIAITHIREGDATDEIIIQAQEIKADLIVLGHEDKGFLAQWFLGSTGADLIRKIPCSLLIATEV